MFPLSPLPRNLAAALRDAEHQKVDVRRSALADLGRWAGSEDRTEASSAVAALEACLIGDDDERVRADAALALADAGARGAVPALVTAATDDASERVRQLALVALGEVGRASDADAVAVVRAALESETPALRFQAVIALSHLDPDSLLAQLRVALRDDDAHVRYVALRLAEERWLERDGDELPKYVAEAARTALTDDAAEVRLAAAILLARSGDATGQEALVAAVNDGTGAREPEDEQAAVELAGKLGLERAARGLARRAWGLLPGSARFSWHARVALARMGDERARDAILRGLKSWTRDARTHAVVAAGEAGLEAALPALRAMAEDPRRADPGAVKTALSQLDAAK